MKRINKLVRVAQAGGGGAGRLHTWEVYSN